MTDHTELTQTMERVIHKYTQWESKKRTYGTDTLLSKAEIHTIAAVGDHPEINITALAEVLGITKGAASQMIYKLVRKGCVEKQSAPTSDAAVVLRLTPAGQINYAAHAQYHQAANDAALALLAEMPQSVYQEILAYLSAFEASIDDALRRDLP